MNFVEGEILLIDKPLDWTSFDVVNKLKYALKKKYPKIKIGHAGTLDPKATGLLIVCTGKKTKTIQEIQDAPKTYTGSIYLGATTPCFDTEQEIDQTFDISAITNEQILQNAKSFLGEQQQFPPAHSAIKINGKRAYELARKGIDFEIKSKTITITKFDITKIDLPNIFFEIDCTKGTYIRTIANDFGIKLNNGAFLSSLRRTKIGNFNIDNSYTIENLIDKIDNENL